SEAAAELAPGWVARAERTVPTEESDPAETLPPRGRLCSPARADRAEVSLPVVKPLTWVRSWPKPAVVRAAVSSSTADWTAVDAPGAEPIWARSARGWVRLVAAAGVGSGA